MQTFMPYTNPHATAACLDYRRLGKQRVECKQILNALAKGSGGWANHPATKMWRGYENALRYYGNAMIYEWTMRGYNNTMPVWDVTYPIVFPPWMHRADVLTSHRSNLLRKDSEYYSQFNWNVSHDLEYVWPLEDSDAQARHGRR